MKQVLLFALFLGLLSCNGGGSEETAEQALLPAPGLLSVTPELGSELGGTSLTISGDGFLSGAVVTVGGSDCDTVNVVDSETITCETTAHAAGKVSVEVSNVGSETALLADAYTYTLDPWQLNTLNFDGTDDYVSVALPTPFNDVANNDITIESWIYLNPGSATRRVFHAELDDDNLASVLISSSNLLIFYIVKGGTTVSRHASSTLPDSTWMHLAVTWRANSDEIKMYLDGAEVGTSIGGGTSKGADALLGIGAKSDGTQVFSGSMDELRVWNSVRTPAQISANMRHSFIDMPSDLVLYYKFNQGTAGADNSGVTTLTDSLSAYPGTLSNFTLDGASSNWITSTIP